MGEFSLAIFGPLCVLADDCWVVRIRVVRGWWRDDGIFPGIILSAGGRVLVERGQKERLPGFPAVLPGAGGE